MNVLVLGGTVFFGRHLVAALIAQGHRVTTFNRGTHEVDTELPIARLIGDRTEPGALDAIPADGRCGRPANGSRAVAGRRCARASIPNAKRS